MLILIHGDDIVSSRKAIDTEKAKYEDSETIYIDIAKTDISEILTACESPSLFSNSRTIIIENLFSSGLNKTKEKILIYINTQKTEYQIIIWEKTEIKSEVIKKYLNKAKVITCQPPLLLFKFLDTLGENTDNVITLFHRLLEQREEELVFTMLFRQFRYLIIAKDLKERGLKDMSAWQRVKFINQARLFDKDKLIKSYRNLLSIDYNIKTGQTSYTLRQLLDIFLINL